MRALLRVPTLLILVVFLVLLILWPSPQDNRSQRANSLSPDSTAHVLKLGYNMPSGSAMDLAAVRFAEQVEKLSAGRLKIELHPNQQLGNDHQMLEMARQGTIDLLLTPTAKLSSAIPEM